MSSDRRISLMRSRWEDLEAEATRLWEATDKVWNSPEFVAARAAYQKAVDAYQPHAERWDEMYVQYKAAQVAAKRAGETYRAALACYSLAS